MLIKCGGICYTIDGPYARVCVSNKVKNMEVKIFNLLSGVNETRFLVQHESCTLNESVCNSKPKIESWWMLGSECKELNDSRFCNDHYMWNPSICNCECNKACKIDEYLYTKTCSCRKRLFGELV